MSREVLFPVYTAMLKQTSYETVMEHPLNISFDLFPQPVEFVSDFIC